MPAASGRHKSLFCPAEEPAYAFGETPGAESKYFEPAFKFYGAGGRDIREDDAIFVL